MYTLEKRLTVTSALFCGRRIRFQAFILVIVMVLVLQFFLIHFETSTYNLNSGYPAITRLPTAAHLIKEEKYLLKTDSYSAKVLLLNGKVVSEPIFDRIKEKPVVSLKRKQFENLWEKRIRWKQNTYKNRFSSNQKQTEKEVIDGVQRLGNSHNHQQLMNLILGPTLHKNSTSPSINTELTKTVHMPGEKPQERVTSTKESHSCPNATLYFANQLDISYGACKPHKPTQAACKFAYELYNKNPVSRQCLLNQMTGDICHIKVVRKMKTQHSFLVHCNSSICSAMDEFINPFRIKILDAKTGELKTEEFETINELERGLVGIIKKTIYEGFYFVFVQCLGNEGEWSSQLLPTDLRLTIQKFNSPRDTRLLNVNIVLLDSVARRHFYRSLPQTVKIFQSWVDHPSSAPATVLDFELFQAVEGHTAENTHALFTGTFIKPNSSGSVEMDVLFRHYKKAGYQTIWQEDLCFKGVWGLMLDLKASDWTDIQRLSKEAGIDHTGLTFSSCEILRANGEETPFNGPKGDQICYNGKFQHTYLTKYLKDTVTAVQQNAYAKPSLFYMALNVGHDYTGRRIQTLDDDLAALITSLAHQSNTLTFILADHGNTYAGYTSSILEGRFEMFHPSLFVIVPNNVARLLGDKAMNALKINQRRLVTAFDLHHSLMALAGPLSKEVRHVGIFTPIHSNRTCNDIQLKTPNLCVCEGWDSPTSNDSFQIAIAEFAVGKLNDMIQNQYDKLENETRNVAKSCRRIQPVRFENVRERNSKLDGSLITSMDIIAKAGDAVEHKEDIFHVEVQSEEFPNQISLEMKLLNFERITLYGKYKQCADMGVLLKLCICSTEQVGTGKSAIALYKQSEFLGTSLYCEPLSKSCLLLCKRNHGEGKSFAIEIANFCLNIHFTVRIRLKKVKNIKLSRASPFKLDTPPNTVRFAMSGRKDVGYWSSTFIIKTEIVRTVRKTLK